MTKATSLPDAVRELRGSAKFQAWGRLHLNHLESSEISKEVVEKHYAPDELAELWGISTETIRSIFREEPGVLKIGKTGGKYKRGYVTLRIPGEVAERVHRRLSA